MGVEVRHEGREGWVLGKGGDEGGEVLLQVQAVQGIIHLVGKEMTCHTHKQKGEVLMAMSVRCWLNKIKKMLKVPQSTKCWQSELGTD